MVRYLSGNILHHAHSTLYGLTAILLFIAAFVALGYKRSFDYRKARFFAVLSLVVGALMMIANSVILGQQAIASSTNTYSADSSLQLTPIIQAPSHMAFAVSGAVNGLYMLLAFLVANYCLRHNSTELLVRWIGALSCLLVGLVAGTYASATASIVFSISLLGGLLDLTIWFEMLILIAAFVLHYLLVFWIGRRLFASANNGTPATEGDTGTGKVSSIGRAS